jgi:CheY-like chemotaxis protein
MVTYMSGAGLPIAEGRKIRILVVDDNADAANSLGRLLSLLGKEVRVALNGEAALAQLAQFDADVVLLDLGMHGMDGFETAQQIRARVDWKDVALIALTGWGQEQDRQRTDAAGFAAHLVKPVNIDQVEAAIARAIAPTRVASR